MPRKTNKNAPPKDTTVNTQPYYLEAEAPWGGFINLRFSQEQADAFLSWLKSDDGRDYARLVDDMLGEGIKTTLTFDQLNSCYVCAVTGALCHETPKFRYSSTSRAGSIAEVLAMTTYKHFIVAQGDYSDFRPTKVGNGLAWG